LKDYLRIVLLTAAVGLYAFLPLLKAQFMLVTGKQHRREMVNHPSPKIPLLVLLNEMKFSIVILSVLILGLVQNPIALLFHFPWIIPFLISPLILYVWQQPTTSLDLPKSMRLTLIDRADKDVSG
jgi:hypothetical protein